MTNEHFSNLFGSRSRKEGDEITQHYMDIAASVQAVTEEIVLKQAKELSSTTKSQNLCLAGGVALNCVVNGKLQKQGCFKNIWIQPAAGDAGGSVGAAYAVHHIMLNNKRNKTEQRPNAGCISWRNFFAGHRCAKISKDGGGMEYYDPS